MLPAPESLTRNDFEIVARRLAEDIAHGMDASRFIGSGYEYVKSRPYVQGDPTKSIDWKVVARTGKPFVKEFETLKRTAVYIIVDTSTSMSVASVRISKHDLAVWIASAIGIAAQRQLRPVTVVSGGERDNAISTGLGRHELRRAIEPLRMPGRREATRISRRIEEINARAVRGSMIVILSDFHDPQALPALRKVAPRHDCLAIHLVDPAEETLRGAGVFRAVEAESGRSFVATSTSIVPDRNSLRGEIARAGANYLRLSTEEEFVAPLRQFLCTRPAAGGGRG